MNWISVVARIVITVDFFLNEISIRVTKIKGTRASRRIGHMKGRCCSVDRSIVLRWYDNSTNQLTIAGRVGKQIVERQANLAVGSV